MTEEKNLPQQIDRTLFPIGEERESLGEWLKILAEAPYYKKMGGIPAMVSIILTGRELGIGPMASLNGGFWDIQGRIIMSAEMMRAKVFKAGHSIQKISLDEKHCRLKGRRKTGEEWDEIFTMEDANIAGLTSKDNWKKHKKDMMLASCTRKLCRGLFPDIFEGASMGDDADIIEINPILQPAQPLVEVPQYSDEEKEFIEKYELETEGSDGNEFIKFTAEKLCQKVEETIKQCAKDQGFDDGFKKYVKCILNPQRKGDKKTA